MLKVLFGLLEKEREIKMSSILNQQLDMFYKGFELGRKFEKNVEKEDKIKEDYCIPALVKYKEIPAWWKMKENKAKLMGSIVLVKTPKVTAFPDSLVSIREGTNEKGSWTWNKEDLILWPTEEQFRFEQARIKLGKGFK